MHTDAALDRYVATLADLTRDALPEFKTLLASEIRFRDPVNETFTADGYVAVLDDMFERIGGVDFDVRDKLAGENGRAMIAWRLTDTGEGKLCIDGASRLTFADDGLLVEHIDFWDPAGDLYERVPVLGFILKRLRRRLSAPGAVRADGRGALASPDLSGSGA